MRTFQVFEKSINLNITPRQSFVSLPFLSCQTDIPNHKVLRMPEIYQRTPTLECARMPERATECIMLIWQQQFVGALPLSRFDVFRSEYYYWFSHMGNVCAASACASHNGNRECIYRTPQMLHISCNTHKAQRKIETFHSHFGLEPDNFRHIYRLSSRVDRHSLSQVIGLSSWIEIGSNVAYFLWIVSSHRVESNVRWNWCIPFR